MNESVAIAVLAPLTPEDMFDSLWEGVWEATFDLASFGVRVEDLPTERYDVAGQRDVLNRFLQERVDALALVPAHVSALNDLIDQLEERGTRVVTFYGDAPASRRSAFVGPDPHQAGVLAGELLAKLMGCRGRVLSFPGAAEECHFPERHRGFHAELARYPTDIEETHFTAELEGMEGVTEELAAACRAADGFYVGSENLVKVAAALEELGVRRPCVGFGNTKTVQPFLERRTVWAVIDESRHQEAYFAVQKAYQAILRTDKRAKLGGVRIPSAIVLAADASLPGDSLNDALEVLVRQRTMTLTSYKEKLEEANAKLLSLATTDPLTGLFNRRKFEEVLEQEAARALRNGALSLLMIDVDLFKNINDRYGHQAGDEALKTVAAVLKASCRSTDVCARLGGDEFAIALPHTEGSEAVVVRNRILGKMPDAPVTVGEEQFTVNLSIGAATLPGDAYDVERLMAAADASMYRAKESSHAAAEVSRGAEALVHAGPPDPLLTP